MGIPWSEEYKGGIYHVISGEKECVVAFRKELKNYSSKEIKDLINDIERSGFKYHVLEY